VGTAKIIWTSFPDDVQFPKKLNLLASILGVSESTARIFFNSQFNYETFRSAQQLYYSRRKDRNVEVEIKKEQSDKEFKEAVRKQEELWTAQHQGVATDHVELVRDNSELLDVLKDISRGIEKLVAAWEKEPDVVTKKRSWL
jgi:hypothetical protein